MAEVVVKSGIGALGELLFDALQRLANSSPEALESEVLRARATEGLAGRYIDAAKVEVSFAQVLANSGQMNVSRPTLLGPGQEEKS